MLFDIVIPYGPNDDKVVRQQVEHNQKNVVGYRNMYLVSHDPTIEIDGCITIDERSFGFTKEDVASYNLMKGRDGWYLQQLLKLYAGLSIPGILNKYLIIDCDTMFLRPTTFIEDGKSLFNPGGEHHRPYFVHMAKLHPSLRRMVGNESGISHHMMFDTERIMDLMMLVMETKERDGEKFWRTYLENILPSEASGSAGYEIYFNYMKQYHPDEIKIRHLKWKNVKSLRNTQGLDYVSYHWWLR